MQRKTEKWWKKNRCMMFSCSGIDGVVRFGDTCRILEDAVKQKMAE